MGKFNFPNNLLSILWIRISGKHLFYNQKKKIDNNKNQNQIPENFSLGFCDYYPFTAVKCHCAFIHSLLCPWACFLLKTILSEILGPLTRMFYHYFPSWYFCLYQCIEVLCFRLDHECTFERSCLAVVSTYRSPQGIQCTGPGQRCLISTEMHLVWTQGHHHHLQYKPLLPAHIASQDRYNLHEVRAHQDWTSQWDPNLCAAWQYKVLGCQKSVNIWAWIGGLKATMACREGEQQWSALSFLPRAPTASLPAWLAFSLEQKTLCHLWRLLREPLMYQAQKKHHCKNQSPLSSFNWMQTLFLDQNLA